MEDLIYEKKGKIAYVTINRPDAMNSFTVSMRQRLAEVWADIDTDPSIWVGILTGAGDRAFCAGADLKEKFEAKESQYLWFWRSTEVIQGVPNSKPMIAAVNGYCLAGGQELALACDIRICSETAQFGAPEVRWNVLHGYGTMRLVKIGVPLAVVMEMILTGERIDAKEAYRIGLVSRVMPPDELMPTAESIANKICENGPISVRATKEIAYRAMEMPLDQVLRFYTPLRQLVHSSEDSKEGPRAFAEKRKPVFKGR